MSKRKRERMKQKASRHKITESRLDDEFQSLRPPSDRAVAMQPTQQPHLASASPEWKIWYAAVSKAIGGRER